MFAMAVCNSVQLATPGLPVSSVQMHQYETKYEWTTTGKESRTAKLIHPLPTSSLHLGKNRQLRRRGESEQKCRDAAPGPRPPFPLLASRLKVAGNSLVNLLPCSKDFYEVISAYSRKENVRMFTILDILCEATSAVISRFLQM
nr:uncharacterized protein LOC106834817 isoform X2 [Equus asinus]